jgi:hypothetical protein
MGRIRTNKQYIVPGALISASYVSDLYDLVTGNMYEDSVLSGSLTVTGSMYGRLTGTASFADHGFYAFNSSHSIWSDSGSTSLSASVAQFATSASYAPNTGVTKIVAGTNVSISPASGIGDITISALGNQGDGTVDFAVTSGSAEYLSVPNKLVLGGVVMIDLGELPTADPHNAGQFWRSGNFVMVSLG